MENNDFFVKSLSYSQLRTFITNTGEWQNQRLLSIYDNTTWVAQSVWTILHKFVETYLKTGKIEDAINYCWKCLYDGSDGKTYIIDPDVIDSSKATLQEVKDSFKTKVVDFKKTGSNETIISNVKAGIEAFLSEEVDYGQIIGLEKRMSYDIVDIIGGSLEVRSPIPLEAITDQVCRTNKERTLLIEGSLQTIPVWSIFLEDTKFKWTQSEMNSEDPTYIFQAFFNYYCVKAEYGEAPKFMNFREIKTAKNKDGSSQHQTITIPFFWETFEEYKVYFWRYLLENFERIKILQERDFIFNIFSQFDGPKEWEKQKAYYLWVPVGQLKSRIAMTQKNKIASNVPVMGDRDPFAWAKKVKEKKWEVELVASIEDRIRVAFQNFWVLVKFEKKIEGYAYDQYLFTPARGVTMWKIKMHTPEIISALEVEKWLRIEAPVCGTKFIGVEIPKQERRFAHLDKIKKSEKPIIPIGINLDGTYEEIDLSDSDTPHLIIAGQTGSWKSEFLKTLVHSVHWKWDIILIDPKRIWLAKMKKFSREYIVDSNDIIFALDRYVQIMRNIYNQLDQLEVESIYEANEKYKYKWNKKYKDTFLIIDELASLIAATRQEVDSKWNVRIVEMWPEILWKIQLLVQLGRAAGFHMIMATQRPSIKVLPWDIKANISARVCFALATKIDSKVVLDEEWAEQLLGKWDMLFMNRWTKRLQGFYI